MIFLLLALGCLAPARGQFGGYEPPPPICPAFSCPAGQKAVGNPDHKIWSYGCKDSGMNIITGLNPNDPLAGLQGNKKNLNKCCVERDICKQTCGMTSKACHENFQKCSAKTCKGDQNCKMQAMISDIMSEPLDDDKAKDEKYDPEVAKCKGYKRGQSQSCKCVPKGDWRSATETHLKAFYGKFNPEKLNKKGEIKDVEEVWKKWKGKEPEMFLALATKYKDKAVQMKEKPKREPYKAEEPVAAEEEPAPWTEPYTEEEPAPWTDPAPSPGGGLDVEEFAFEEKRSSLEGKMREAAAAEDYDQADTLKQEVEALVKDEVKRLKDKKAQSIAEEDYAEAKRLKLRLAKLEL